MATDDADSRPNQAIAALALSLEGRDVALGRTPAGLVTRFVDSFRRGLQSVLELLESRTPPRIAENRRHPQWVERACDLPLIGLEPGGVRVLLGAPPADSLFSDSERGDLLNAVEVLFGALEWAAGAERKDSPAAFESLPAPARRAVLAVVARLLPPPSGPVERVGFRRPGTRGESGERRATLDRPARRRVRVELDRLAAEGRAAEAEGVIRSVDLDSRTFALRERPGNLPDLPCDYGPGAENAVKTCLDRRVLVSGTLETVRGRRGQRMAVEAVELTAGATPVARAG